MLLALDLGMHTGWALFTRAGARLASGVWHLGKDTVRGRFGELLLYLRTKVGVTRSLDWGRGYLGYRIASETADQPTIGLQLEDVQRLEPVPYKGALGFFNVMGGELPEAYRTAWRELGGAA